MVSNSFRNGLIRSIAARRTERRIVSRDSETTKNGRLPSGERIGGNMALKKRGKTWHCHFVVNGQRFRQSLCTTDWREAQAKEKELIAEAQAGKLHQTS